MLSDKPFTKENLDQYLKELAKEYRKRSGKNTEKLLIFKGESIPPLDFWHAGFTQV